MNTPKYDIFSGSGHRDAMWIEAVECLGAANERMKELATEKPGPYFVFCATRGVVLARVDTTGTGTGGSEKARAAS
jgi:hypothetical protein